MTDYFNAVERLEKFYGDIPEMEKAWIEDNIESLTDEQKGKFFKALTTSHEFKNGYPEISVMATVYKNVMNKAPKTYAWSICKECGCEYDYRLPCCPACYEKGLYCNVYAVKSSASKPAIVQYNKTYLNGGNGETTCFNCEHKKNSYCKNFGNPNWNCKREEFESCDCKICCSLAKRENQKLAGKDVKTTYAIPLKRGAEKMKCRFCPCQVENSNEIDGYQPNGCFYGDDYLDDYCYEDKDGDCCCDKTKEEIEGDISEYQENMMNDMKLLAEEMENQLIANYDFERGDVKY